jgi:hypothetical protein
MKPDLYTKAVLTLIALLLAVIACNQYVHPETTASAQTQGPFDSVRYAASGDGRSHYFFDTRTGDLWEYTHHSVLGARGMYHNEWGWDYWGKVTQLGQPLAKSEQR